MRGVCVRGVGKGTKEVIYTIDCSPSLHCYVLTKYFPLCSVYRKKQN